MAAEVKLEDSWKAALGEEFQQAKRKYGIAG